jgi:exocyst complex component 6
VIQTWGFPVGPFDNFLLSLFEKYAELLKRRFSDDFQEVHIFHPTLFVLADHNQIVSTDDYMPMPINNMEEFEKVVNVSWYTLEKSPEELK